MAELTLQAYEERIRAFLEAEQYEDAILWSQHLLRTFPKYIRGYEYLAQAAMEVDRDDEALDLFRRVLSADPENVIAYTGIALIFRRMNVLPEAIWHMMRAFELQPGTPFIREQLRDLYAQHEGRRPGRLKLNRAALGRAHLRNGQYEMAIRELMAELAEDPTRIDLRVALAEALWRAERYREAVDQAELVLQELPLALKANLILGQFYAQEGDTDQAAEYLQIAQRLDPENRVARQLFGNRSPLPLREVTISEPSPEPAPAEPEPFESGDFTWTLEEEVEFTTEKAESLDWRNGLRKATEEMLAHLSATPSPPPVDWRNALRQETETMLASLLPQWVVLLRSATEEALTAPVTVEEEEVAPAPPPGVEPDWVNDLRRATGEALERLSEVEAEAVAPSEGEPVAPPPEAPRWVADLRQAVEEAVTAAFEALPAVPEEELGPLVPEWVNSLYEATLAALAEVPAETTSQTPAEAPVEETLEPPVGEPETVAGIEEEPVSAEAPHEPVEAAPGEVAVVPEVELPEPELEETPAEPVEAVSPEVEQVDLVPETRTVVDEGALPVEAPPPEEAEADELERARALAFAGQEAEALALFTAVFEAGDRDEALAEALAEWVAQGTTGPEPHQLLGDVYRRLGRHREALEQYRTALQKLSG